MISPSPSTTLGKILVSMDWQVHFLAKPNNKGKLEKYDENNRDLCFREVPENDRKIR